MLFVLFLNPVLLNLYKAYYAMLSFAGKRGVILGIANARSIAFEVTKQLDSLGAELICSYAPDPKDRFKQYVEGLQKTMRIKRALPMDVQYDDQIEAFFKGVEEEWGDGGLDFVLHSLAFADRADLQRPFSQTPREGWRLAQDISAYSLTPITRLAAPFMRQRNGGSVVCMSFIGSVLAVPHYNVMGPAKAAMEAAVRYLAREYGPEGIRCNAVSAGALRTLSSSGIKNFGGMLKVAGEHSALERNVTVQEIATPSVFLLSGASSGMTGQTLYVDGGFNVMAN